MAVSLVQVCIFLSRPHRPQSEKLVPYFPANVYVGNRPLLHHILRQRMRVLYGMIFIVSKLWVMGTSFQAGLLERMSGGQRHSKTLLSSRGRGAIRLESTQIRWFFSSLGFLELFSYSPFGHRQHGPASA